MPRDPRPPTVAFTGTVWRWNSYDVAWWADRNHSVGRWHDEHSPPTQYVALSPTGAWAEMVRFFGITDPEDLLEARHNLWRGRLRLDHVADLTDSDACERHGLPPGALTADDHGTCQLESHRLRRLGFDGVLAPSAALSGATNLVVWGARRPIAWVPLSPTDPSPRPPVLPSDLPTERTAVGGPASSLVDRVVQRT
ncbi:MAG: RES family NAD+ phosphorylase [Patulibacter sp.]|nr:RES family NAD+ phosphorylase [Patulibacter sp.]